MRRGIVALGAALILMFAPSTVGAQGSCRFVLGFADMATRLGAATVGVCLENQRTITGEESFDLGTVKMTLPAGTAVQRTTKGVLSWSPSTNYTFFRDAWGQHILGDAGLTAKSWDELIGVQQLPPSPQSTSLASQCESLAYDATRGVPRTSVERLTATWGTDDVTAAAEEMCNEAAATHGARGLICFESAFAAARGRERLFPGQGFSAYQGAFDRCIASR